MPRIISYTPAWLCRPSAGFELFSSEESPQPAQSRQRAHKDKSAIKATGKETNVGARRTIARRGTEIFVLVGNTVRWADLCMLKDDWETKEHDGKLGRFGANDPTEEETTEPRYKTLNIPIHEQIKQLIPSPNGELMAILTSHTVRIVGLPDSSHLHGQGSETIKIKTNTLGPTTHVLSQSPVITALWHPLGVNGDCLVTVTADAVVRLWEIKRDNRWCYDEPTLAIDLKKLHHGTCAEEDFGATKIGVNRGFSVEYLDMEVVSACFGGTGSETESGWSSMTLWVAMVEGDVYALCPLLPSKWQPPALLVPSLTTTIAAKAGRVDETAMTAEEKRRHDEQYQWVREIDKQDLVKASGGIELFSHGVVYDRPAHPGPIPRLQGPFSILPEESDDDIELSDIRVIASKLDMEELVGSDEDEFDISESEGLSTAVVCLLAKDGRVYICLDLEGVEGDWLPPKKVKSKHEAMPMPQPELALLEVVDTLRQGDGNEFEWPTFSDDVHSRYSFFVTHSQGVFFLSLEPWLENLENELQDDADTGVEFRMDVVTKSCTALRERILSFERPADGGSVPPVATAVILQDPDLGYFLLTVSSERALAALLDTKKDTSFDDEGDNEHDYAPDFPELVMEPARPSYQIPEALYQSSTISTFIETHVHHRYRRPLKDEIRLSSATLELMTAAHRILSRETHELGVIVADIFSRCERLQEELRDQIRRANEVASKIEHIRGEDDDDFPAGISHGNKSIDDRLLLTRQKHSELATRHEALKRKLAKAGGRNLSTKEQSWKEEVEKLNSSTIRPEEDHEEHEAGPNPWQRYAEVQALAKEMLAHAAGVSSPKQVSNGPLQVPPDIRKFKVAQVMDLLERETALVDAAQERLGRLSLGRGF